MFVVGEHGDAPGLESAKEFGRVAFPVENNDKTVEQGIGSQLLLARLAGDFAQKAGHNFFFEHFLQAGIHCFGYTEKGAPFIALTQ